MRPVWGDDYSICCCVSATETGKEMQFFGARANLAKCLLYAINGGVDEKNKVQVGPAYQPITSEYLDYDEVMEKYDQMMEWLSKLYVDTLNMIHYMHDKYYYEAAQMALIDTDVKRSFATGIAGFSHVVDSLSAIKYAKVKVVRDEDGLATDFEIEGDFPRYGNDDDRADEIAVWLSEEIHAQTEQVPHIQTFCSRQHLSLQLHLTLYMVRLQDLFRTEEKLESHFHQELTRLTAQSRADFLLLLTLLLSFHTSLHLTESLIHRQSTQVHLDILMKSVKRTLLTYWMDTSIREHIT